MPKENRPSHLSPKDAGLRISREAPSGQRLLEKTLTIVNTALRESVPPKFHPQISLTPELIKFSGSPEKLREIEKEEKGPKSGFIYAGLQRAGVPSEVLDIQLFAATLADATVPTYWDKSGTIHLADDVRDRLSGDAYPRAQMATFLGFKLVNDLLRRLPEPLELPPFPWREIVRNRMGANLDQMRQKSKKYEGFKEEEFNAFIQNANSLLGEKKTRFIARGAEVQVLLPGQTTETADIKVGTKFDNELIALLSRPIKDRFIAIISMQTRNIRFTEPEVWTIIRRILEAMQGKDLPTDTTTAYLDSLIPAYYPLLTQNLYFKGQEIANPWVYPA